jgi:hypothetical protein
MESATIAARAMMLFVLVFICKKKLYNLLSFYWALKVQARKRTSSSGQVSPTQLCS